MPPRYRKKSSKLLKHAKWFVAGAAVADLACLGVGYYFYREMTSSSDFRYKIYNYDQRFVDMYYRANEKYGDGKARENDYQKWDIQKIDSFSFSNWLL